METRLRKFFVSARRLIVDARGAAIVEFAICGSVFIALLLACVQTGIIYFMQQSLQTAAESGTRYIMTGQAQNAKMTARQFRTYVCQQTLPILDCSKVMVDVRSASSFSSIDPNKPGITYNAAGKVTNKWEFDMGSAGSIMIVRVMYLWNTPLGPLNLDFSDAGAGKRLLMGSMVFKSEPFQI
ncbi:MAG TPA: TadE/TadG family type IV pilus assembly protein [Sphingobium sp.]